MSANEYLEDQASAWRTVAKRLWKVTDRRVGKTGVEMALNIINDLETNNAQLRARLADAERLAAFCEKIATWAEQQAGKMEEHAETTKWIEIKTADLSDARNFRKIANNARTALAAFRKGAK